MRGGLQAGVVIKTCLFRGCGKSFKPGRSNQEYCNRVCRASAKNLRSQVVRVNAELAAELRGQMARLGGQKKQGNPTRAGHRPRKRGKGGYLANRRAVRFRLSQRGFAG